jgi:hypothetical protein
MRILAVYNPKSGGSYHRVKLWSEFVENVTLVQELTEELVSECNILYIHWNSRTPIVNLSIWREKYGFKVIVDIDDVWVDKEGYELHNFLSQHLCLFADQVICSTEYLVPGIMEWNKNIKVIPNYLPMGHGQFTMKTKIHKKVRVGIGGSISHYEDYLSLQPIIRKLEKEKWFQDNCEFAIIGYNNLDKRWQKVAKMFKNVKLFKAKSCEDYMSLYDELDIMLSPLLDTELNRGRSNLKVYECISKGIVPIVDWNISPHDPICEYLIEIDPAYIKHYTQNNARENLIHTTLKYCIDNCSYGIHCVDSRIELFNKVLNQPTIQSNHDLYSVTYSVDQDVEYKRINNKVCSVEEKSYLFEYNKILEYTECWETFSDISYLGYFSHKFPYKTGFYKKYVEEILDNEDSDVITFCKQTPTYLAWTEQQHPGFMNVFQKVCDKLDLIVSEPRCTIYSNFFVAKSHIYKEYVQLLQRAIDIMENDPEIRKLCWQDAQYKSGLNTEDLKKYTGLDFYTFHTFILERLISVWIDNKGLTYAVYT